MVLEFCLVHHLSRLSVIEVFAYIYLLNYFIELFESLARLLKKTVA